MPYAAHKYDKVMGGTDRQDQNVKRLRTSIRSRKWWWALFTWGLDVTVQNAWLIYKSINPDMKLVAFRSVARELLLLNGSKPYGGQRVKNKLRNSSNYVSANYHILFRIWSKRNLCMANPSLPKLYPLPTPPSPHLTSQSIYSTHTH